MSCLSVNTKLLRKILVSFIREEICKTGLKTGILGLSGGIDSALVVFLAAEALGAENVHAVCMPRRAGTWPIDLVQRSRQRWSTNAM